MSKVSLTLLFVVLAVAPSLAEKERVLPVTAQKGLVTFTCTITGSDNDGFDFNAENKGPDDTDCKATCKFKLNGTSTKESKKYDGTLRGTETRGGPLFQRTLVVKPA